VAEAARNDLIREAIVVLGGIGKDVCWRLVEWLPSRAKGVYGIK